MPTMLGNGVYTLSEAAQLVGLKRSRVREWFRIREGKQSPIFQSDYESVEGDLAISFLDLIDVFVAGQLRDHGVTLQTLRCVFTLLAKDLQTPHPFARQELLSDGKEVFTRGLDDAGREEMTEVLTRQKVFPAILLPFLKTIDYGERTKLAERWHIAAGVVVDPRICFGKPVVEAVSIPTSLLAAASEANDENAEVVASWYDVHPDHVRAAVRFERMRAA